jgi:3-polyprenyl-4-hydroxybenzoate decarboxylase
MDNKLERCGRKQLWPNLRYYPGICLEVLRKVMKNIIQTAHFPNTNQKDYYLSQPVHRMVSYSMEKQTEDDQSNMMMRIFGPKKQNITRG